MWFKDLFGFEEVSPEYVRDKITVEGNQLFSKVNGKSYTYGEFETPKLRELKCLSGLDSYTDAIKVKEIRADVQELHCDPSNRNALFQAASQFNTLEMVGPHVTPERGIGIYEYDKTQGPACAIACGAGTTYRNYFVPNNGEIGQSATNQIDCLESIGYSLGNHDSKLWQMSNGYVICNHKGLLNVNAQIHQLNKIGREELKEQLKVGIQWNTEVTLNNSQQLVSQVYCSALPVAYSHIESFYWEPFASIVLEATYEATLHAALINYKHTSCNKVFLTYVGGGAFGNDMDWISKAMTKALSKFKQTPLDVRIVTYGG